MSNHAGFHINRKRALMTGGGALVTALVGVGAATSASADPSGAVDGLAPAGNVADLDLTADQIVFADEHVTLNGLHYEFDEVTARQELDSATVDKVLSAIEAWNSNVGASASDGGMVALAGGKTLFTGPHGSISAHWYGLKIQFDGYLAGKVQAGTATLSVIAAGVGLATASTAVGGIAGGVVASALAGASGVIGLCQDPDGSVTWYWLLNGVGVCNPFA